MAALSYSNFDLILSKEPSGRYQVRVEAPDGGQPKEEFRPPFTQAELEELQQTVEGTTREVIPSGGQGSEVSDRRSRVKLFGERLYDAIFVNNIRSSLALSLQAAQLKGAGVRIRLRLDKVPELADLPWEYLYDPDTRIHLALQPLTPIVRHLDLPGPASSLLVEPPINVLVMISNPSDRISLDGAREWENIREALHDLTQAKLVSVSQVKATIPALQACLQKQGCHIFHYVGHGGFDETGDAVLLFEDEQGKASPVTGTELNVALGHSSLRLVVLNSCDTARAPAEDPFAGLAQGLVRMMIPAVVAMQWKIIDTGAITFAKAFYGAIANNLPVDGALVEARKGMFLAKYPTEWGTPVLFMRGADGRIFQIDQPSAKQLRDRQIKALSDDARSAIDEKDYDAALHLLQEIKVVLASNHPLQ